MSERMSKRRRRLLALGIGLAILLGLVFGMNAYARSEGFGGGLLSDFLTPPEAIGWRWLPDQSVESPHGFTIEINGYGMRDPREVAIPKPDGVFRVLCLGDSFTYGLMEPRENIYPYLLEQSLGGVMGDRTVEVWNSGVNGYHSCQERAWLEHYGWALEPDLVTVGFVMNDVLPHAEMPRQFPGRTWMLRWPLYHWLRHQVVNRWKLMGSDPQAARIQRIVAEHEGKILSSPFDPQSAPFWEQATGCLDEIAAACEQRGIPAVLIVFPSLPQMLEPEPMPEQQQVLMRTALRNAFIPVDLLARYAEAGEDALQPSDKAHPSALGHRIAAEEIMIALQGAGVVPTN